MNMFKPVEAKTTEEYMQSLPSDRKEIIHSLDAFIRTTVPSLDPVFAYNMPGYGLFTYTNYKKEVIKWPVIALASQKNYISLYVCAVENGEYVAEKYKKTLGKVSVGKSCIRFTKWEDLDLKGLTHVLKLAEKSPGLENLNKKD